MERRNTQKDCPLGVSCSSALLPPITDRLQLAMAGLYGGAFHRSSEVTPWSPTPIMDQFLH
jgi:hypothetical protein